jgi:FkbM family methyltransferase
MRLRAATEGDELKAALLGRPGSTFVDVGANAGLYSYFAARRGFHVVAFEPLPELADRLIARLAPEVDVRSIALGAERGSATLHVPVVEGRDVTTRSSLSDKANEGLLTREVQVPVYRLDEVSGLDDVGVIKIDVEGLELDVLQGSSSLLDRDRPLVLVESEERHVAGGPSQVFDLMRAHDYEGRFLMRGYSYSVSKYSSKVHQAPEKAKKIGSLRHATRYINNFVFLPREDVVVRGQLDDRWPQAHS